MLIRLCAESDLFLNSEDDIGDGESANLAGAALEGCRSVLYFFVADDEEVRDFFDLHITNAFTQTLHIIDFGTNAVLYESRKHFMSVPRMFLGDGEYFYLQRREPHREDAAEVFDEHC